MGQFRQAVRWIARMLWARPVARTGRRTLVDGLTPQFVQIGEDFRSGPGSLILSHDASTFQQVGRYRVEMTRIGSHVFLGAYAIVLPGVTIGDWSIIGAGSVVTRDVPDHTVVAGNPARIICSTAEYVAKCEARNCLYEPPAGASALCRNEPLSDRERRAFQQSIIEEARRRGNYA